MPGFRLPVFNLSVNVWRAGVGPPLPPNVVTPGQLRIGRIRFIPVAQSGAGTFPFNSVALVVPRGTDVRSAALYPVGDLVEVPAGTKRFYRVSWVEDIAKGFSNEHRLCIMFQDRSPAGAWPFPIP